MARDEPHFPDEAAIARRAIPLLDLTDLSEPCDASAITALCASARAAGVAAVCLWPRFVAQAARALAGSGVRVATVVNFPHGGEDVAREAELTRQALSEGADEIDLVLPYRAVLRGDPDAATAMVRAAREACGPKHLLKVILETGELRDVETVAAASRLALEAGADMIKTSTGKTPVSATPEAAEAMLRIILEVRGGRAGLKVSGGLRRIEDAAGYLALADRVMGPDWASPDSFRIGASSLLAALNQALEPSR